MMEEKFTLTHNQFARLAPEAFKNLFNDEYFSDITLATKDNKQIKAHPKKCCRQPKETYGEDWKNINEKYARNYRKRF